MASETNEQWVVVIIAGDGDRGEAYGPFVPAAAAEHALWAQAQIGDAWREDGTDVFALPLQDYPALARSAASYQEARAEMEADAKAAEQAAPTQPAEPPIDDAYATPGAARAAREYLARPSGAKAYAWLQAEQAAEKAGVCSFVEQAADAVAKAEQELKEAGLHKVWGEE